MAQIGRNIATIRILKDITQERLASALGISKQAYSKIERSGYVAERRLSQIAKLLGVTVNSLSAFEEDDLYAIDLQFNLSSKIHNGDAQSIFDLYEQIRKYQEELLKVEREKVSILKSIISQQQYINNKPQGMN